MRFLQGLNLGLGIFAFMIAYISLSNQVSTFNWIMGIILGFTGALNIAMAFSGGKK
jgi:hypothetical protein